MTTLEEAQKYVNENMVKGVECPCCKRFVKSYKFSITSTMAIFLLLAFKYTKDHNTDRFLMKEVWKTSTLPANVQRSDEAKLRHWGLLAPVDGKRDDGSKRTGEYVITTRGKLFALDKVSVPKHIVLYNNQIVSILPDKVWIKECLKKRFNYSEIMEGYQEPDNPQTSLF